MKLEVSGANFLIDTVLFDLEGIDVVLGMAWLTSLGTMLVDWGKQVMDFTWEGKAANLHGEGYHSKVPSSFQSLCVKSNKKMQLRMEFLGVPP